jgi:hypothetical protein
MALITVNRNPSERHLKQFGWASLVLLPFAGWAFLGFRPSGRWSPFEQQLIEALVLLGLALAIAAAFRPRAIRPMFIAVSLVTFPIGLVVGEITLLTMYFGVFLPLALIFRIMGRDALTRRPGNGHATTYWTVKSPPSSVERYFHQY